MSLGASTGFLVLRDLLVDTLVLDGVEVPDPKAADDPKYRGSFRGYFAVPAGTHTLVGRVSGKEHATTVVVHPGWATVKRFDVTDGWADDDADTERHYRRLALSGSMEEAGALRPWPLAVPAADAAAPARVFGDADFAWLRQTFLDSAGTRPDSTALQRYVDALRWHYILDREMGAQAPYFARLGRELVEHVRSRPELLATGAATYLDHFAVDLVDADQPELLEAGRELAAALEQARKVAPAPAPASESAAAPTLPPGAIAAGAAASPEKRSPISPLLMVALVVLFVIGVVFVLRRTSDTPPQVTPVTSAATPSTTAADAVVDLATARKKLSLFVYEADLAKHAELVDAAGRLETALAKDDCLAARKPYDVIKETKVDLTQHTALVLSQIRMLTTVATYCNAWSSPDGKRW